MMVVRYTVVHFTTLLLTAQVAGDGTDLNVREVEVVGGRHGEVAEVTRGPLDLSDYPSKGSLSSFMNKNPADAVRPVARRGAPLHVDPFAIRTASNAVPCSVRPGVCSHHEGEDRRHRN
jgi:hypothetical protein